MNLKYTSNTFSQKWYRFFLLFFPAMFIISSVITILTETIPPNEWIIRVIVIIYPITLWYVSHINKFVFEKLENFVYVQIYLIIIYLLEITFRSSPERVPMRMLILGTVLMLNTYAYSSKRHLKIYYIVAIIFSGIATFITSNYSISATIVCVVSMATLFPHAHAFYVKHKEDEQIRVNLIRKLDEKTTLILEKNKQIKEISEFKDIIIDNAPIQIALLDKDFKYLTINKEEVPNEQERRWLIKKTDLEYCDHFDIDENVVENRFLQLQMCKIGKKEIKFEEKLEYKNSKLIAHIELLQNVKNPIIKPIIETPLQFESGVSAKRILKITNILIEN